MFLIFLWSSALGEQKRFIDSLEDYKPNYFIKTWFLENEGDEQGYSNQEAQFQLSFKKPLFVNLYVAYTHKAFWQMFDNGNSRPFRDHSFNPEVFLEFDDLWSLDHLRVGLWEHESNGDKERYDENGNVINYSRTWDRFYLYGELNLASAFGIGAKVWRITSPKSKEYSDFYDENPDLPNYMGSGELYFYLGKYPTLITLMLRHGWKKNTGTCLVEGRLPILNYLGFDDYYTDLYFQYFYGFGNSLVDYKRVVRRVSIGISFR